MHNESNLDERTNALSEKTRSNGKAALKPLWRAAFVRRAIARMQVLKEVKRRHLRGHADEVTR